MGGSPAHEPSTDSHTTLAMTPAGGSATRRTARASPPHRRADPRSARGRPVPRRHRHRGHPATLPPARNSPAPRPAHRGRRRPRSGAPARTRAPTAAASCRGWTRPRRAPTPAPSRAPARPPPAATPPATARSGADLPSPRGRPLRDLHAPTCPTCTVQQSGHAGSSPMVPVLTGALGTGPIAGAANTRPVTATTLAWRGGCGLAELGPAKPGRSSQVWCSWIVFSGVAWKPLAPQRHDSAPDLLIRTSRHGHHPSASGRRRSVTLTASPCVSSARNGVQGMHGSPGWGETPLGRVPWIFEAWCCRSVRCLSD